MNIVRAHIRGVKFECPVEECGKGFSVSGHNSPIVPLEKRIRLLKDHAADSFLSPCANPEELGKIIAQMEGKHAHPERRG